MVLFILKTSPGRIHPELSSFVLRYLKFIVIAFFGMKIHCFLKDSMYFTQNIISTILIMVEILN